MVRHIFKEPAGPIGDCPAAECFELLGHKWVAFVVWALRSGPLRFKEIAATVPRITDRMLAARLHELEAASIVVRRVVPGSPPGVEYELSDRGRGLVPVIRAMESWSDRWGGPQMADPWPAGPRFGDLGRGSWLSQPSIFPRLGAMRTDAVDEIERALSVLARRANSTLMEERLATETGVRLERAAYSVLGTIGDHDGIRMKDLSLSLALDTSTVSRHAQHLIAAGLVSRDADPDDGRAAVVRLTRTGRTIFVRARSARRAAVEQILSEWSERDRRDLSVLLQRLVEDVVRFADLPASARREVHV